MARSWLFAMIFFSSLLAWSQPVAGGDRFAIAVKNRTYFLDATPDPIKMKAALGLEIPEEIQKQLKAEGREIPNVDPSLPYRSLSESDKVEFAKRRQLFLQYLAITLVRTRFALGTGIILKDSFNFIRERLTGRVSSVEAPFGQRIDLVIQSILQSVDYKLWYQAPLLVRANEFGVSMAIGPSAITGIRHNGVGGNEEIGITFAINVDRRAGVFEFFHNSESYSQSLAALSVVGLQGKLGLSIRSVSHRKPMKTQMGESFYPPAFPGFQTQSSDLYVSGLSSAWGLPPPPFADMLTVTTKFEKNAWVRIMVSPVVRGYVRLYFGRVDRSLILISSRFKGMYDLILSKLGYGRCEAVFAIN